MAKHGKKYSDSVKDSAYDIHKEYEPKEALDLVQKFAKANFDETVEVAVNLAVDPRQADQQIRGAVVLPNGTGKTRKVLVFAQGEKAKEAEAAGADYVGGEEIAKKIQEGWMDFDVTIATPDMMAVVGRLGRVLGPKGLMPNPKTGTVTFDIDKAVKEVKAGKIEYRVDKASIIHAPIGKVSFDTDKLAENLETLMDVLIKAKPESVKGVYIKKVAISSTMGPGLKIDPRSF